MSPHPARPDPADPVIRVLGAASAARLGAADAIESCLRAAVEAVGAEGGAIVLHAPGGTRRERARAGSAPEEGEGVAVGLAVGDEVIGELRLLGCATDDAHVLDAVAAALALVVRSDQLFVGLQDRARTLDRQVRQLVALQEVARAVARVGALDPLAAVIAREARRMVRADASAVLVRAGERDPRVVAGDDAGRPGAWTAGLAALASGRTQVLPGHQAAVPVPGPPGGAVAAICVAREGAPFGPDELDRLSGLAEQAAVAVANVRLLDDLREEQRVREQLAAALADTQERERRRVAEDLHDGPVQELTGLALMLDAIRDGARADAGVLRRDLAAAAEAARSVVGSIRRAIYDLHPMTLEELGFSAAVRVVLERQVRRGVETHMEGLDAADRLPATDRTSAFRIVQEAIANAARHSGATRIVVSGRERAGAVELEVADDGVGFDPDTVRTPIHRGHLGVAAMRERVVLTGAQLEIESAPGRGTRVRARFPLARR